MNRKEAFAYLMDTPNGKVQPDTWKTTSWYLELGGVASAQGGTPDQVMFVSNPTTKQPSTHWPDVVYEIYEVKVAVTGSQVGKSVTEEAAKLGVSPTVSASLASSVKQSLGL